MNPLLKEIRHNKMLRLLVFVPGLFAIQNLKPESHTLLFVLSVLAIASVWRPAREVVARPGTLLRYERWLTSQT